MSAQPRRQLIIAVLVAVLTPLALAHDYTIPGGTTPDGPHGPDPDGGYPPRNPGTGGEPVLLHTGEYVLTVQDETLRGRGLSVVLQRSYRSHSEYNSQFGYGWDLNYNIKVRRTNDPNVLILLDGLNRRCQYTLDPDSAIGTPVYMSPPGRYDTIQHNADGTYTAFKKNGDVLEFDIDGNLTAIVDRKGDAIRFEYDPAGLLPIYGPSNFFVNQTRGLIAREFRLTRIVDDLGRAIDLTYNSNGLVSTITDFADRTWVYKYDPNTNDLVSVTGPVTDQYPSGLTTAYTYDDSHNLLTITDPNGQMYLVNRYDDRDRIEWQRYGEGTFLFSYDPNNSRTTVTDRKGFRREVVYNATGNPVDERIHTQGLRPDDPNAYRTIYAYDANMERTRVIHPAGTSVEYAYDDRGNLLSTCQRANVLEQWASAVLGASSQYGSNDWSARKTLGPPDAYPRCGDNRNAWCPSRKNGGAEYLELQFPGELYATSVEIYETLTPGAVTKVAVKDPADAWRVVWEGTDPTRTCPGIFEVDLEYTAYKTSALRIDLDTSRIDGWSEIDAVKLIGTDQPSLVTTFTYEPRFNRMKSKTDPEGNTTTFVYDYEDSAFGTQVGNLMEIIYPAAGAQTPKVCLTYDPYNRLDTVTAPDGIVTKYEYDDTVHPYGYGHSLPSRVIQDYGAGPECLNITSEFRYDSLGNLVRIVDAEGNVKQFAYDQLNQLTQMIQSQQCGCATHFQYNENGRLASMARPTGNPDQPWQTTSFTYDALDHPRTVTEPLGHTFAFQYDGNENLSAMTDGQDNTTAYVYDERDLLWTVTDARGSTTEYTYNENGQLSRIVDPNGNGTAYDYDRFDRPVVVTYADDTNEVYTYDRNSNVTSKKTRKGELITYQYDALNRVVQKTVPDGPAVTYLYDVSGKLVETRQGSQATFYRFDRLSRLLGVTDPDGREVAYEYDRLGRTVKLVYPDRSFVTYRYDDMSRVTEVRDDNETVLVHYTYDGLCRRLGAEFANGVTTAYAYDLANRLERLSTGGDAWSLSFDYTYDRVGNRLSMTVDGTDLHTYGYDSLYQLTDVQYPHGTNVIYRYDPRGNRETVVNGGVSTYTSNGLNQYTSIDGTILAYDQNGNLLSQGHSTFSYTAENRLKTLSVPGTVVLYEYDAHGRRVQTNANGRITKYVYDGSRIIAEYDSTGTLLRKYIYGPGIDEPIAIVTAGATHYYAFDGLGSVAAISDAHGRLAERYTYDVYGTPTIFDAVGNAVTESALGNPYMFTGRRYDTQTGLYYYRARDYSPLIGRFLQTDPSGYKDGLNLYRYCRNNPVIFVDPDGAEPVTAIYLATLAKAFGGGCAWGIATTVVDQFYPGVGTTIGEWRMFFRHWMVMIGELSPPHFVAGVAGSHFCAWLTSSVIDYYKDKGCKQISEAIGVLSDVVQSIYEAPGRVLELIDPSSEFSFYRRLPGPPGMSHRKLVEAIPGLKDFLDDVDFLYLSRGWLW